MYTATEILIRNVIRWRLVSSGDCHRVGDVKLTGPNTSATRRTDARLPGWGILKRPLCHPSAGDDPPKVE